MDSLSKLQLRSFGEWRKQMLDVITRNGLLGFIDGSVKSPPETQTEEYAAWKESDDLARKLIESRLTDGIKKQVVDLQLKTAQEVWDALPQLVEAIKKRLNHYLPLYKAAIEGNWKTAEEFIQNEPDAVTARITPDSETALIVAVRAVRRNYFVEKLVERMSAEDLAVGDDNGRTALHRAAGSGNKKAAELLVRKNPSLPNQRAYFNRTPLFYAAARGNREMILWLMEVMETKRA